MAVASPPHNRLLIEALLAVGVAAGAFLILGSGGPFDQWTELDFHYLVQPLVLFGSLLLLSTLALWIQWMRLAPLLAFSLVIAGRPQRVSLLPVTQKSLLGAGWVALVSGLLASVPKLPETISAHPEAPDLTSLAPYLQAFDSLAIWVIVLMAPFIVVRAATEVWPWLGIMVVPPWSRLAVFGAAYVMLSGGGILSVALDFPGSTVLLLLGIAVAISYVASMLRVAAGVRLQPRQVLMTRGSLLLAEAGWVVALLMALVALPSAVETVLAERSGSDAGSLSPYLQLMESLARLSVIALTPFALVRATSVFWPLAGRIVGFPIGRLGTVALAYLLFSNQGILSTELELPLGQIMLVLTLAMGASYLGSTLMNVASLRTPLSLGPIVVTAALIGTSLAAALAPAMVIWVVLNHLPVASARLLEHSSTSTFAATYLPYFANFFEVRYAIAGLYLAIAVAVTLPKALVDPASLRYQALVSAIGHSAAGCLAWSLGFALADLGYAYVVIGATTALGLFFLALAQLASYGTNSASPIAADTAKWLSESKVRSFALGASIAFYGVFLRPVVYDVMWFAALYEFLAVLVMVLGFLVYVGRRVRTKVDAPETPSPSWAKWLHHEQVLNTKVDPRSEFMSRLQYGFVQHGDWKPLWTYLIGLLYRNQAPLGAVRAMGRPLRTSVFSRGHRLSLGEQRRARAKRSAAFLESLEAAERALATPSRSLSRVDEQALRQAAVPYVESGTEPEALTAALLAAHSQKGDDLEAMTDHWFPLVNTPEPSTRWFHPPWVRSRIRTKNKGIRLKMVDEAVSYFFTETSERGPVSAGATASGPGVEGSISGKVEFIG